MIAISIRDYGITFAISVKEAKPNLTREAVFVRRIPVTGIGSSSRRIVTKTV
jgi:hypothetical protein